MIEGIPKISVLVITYNQEDVIKRAIDSLLAQKDYIYEICVSDDCSKDRTWNILQEYSAKYPGLFVLNRNDPNIGIFENVEKTWTMPSGDIIYQLAGDDECGEGWLKSVIEFVRTYNIELNKEKFCIYGDYVGMFPEGKQYYYSNKICKSSKNIFSLALRVVISGRGACYSTSILRQFFKVSQGRSHIAESAMDRQLQLFSETNYYIPKVANYYYTGIGESAKIVNTEIAVERIMMNRYMVEKLSVKGYVPSKADLRYMAFDEAFMDFLSQKNIKKTIRLMYKWILSYDPSIGVKSLKIGYFLSHINRLFH